VSIEISITDNDEDTKYTFRDWAEVEGYLEVVMLECESFDNYKELITLPAMDKKVWEKFKRAGDIVFDMMEGS